MAYRTVIPRCPRQQEGITTADTSAHGPLRHSMATSRNRAGRPEQSPAIRVHTEVLALAGRAIAPDAVAALARQQRSSRSVASHHHSLTPPGKHRRSDGTRGPACQPLNRVILLTRQRSGGCETGAPASTPVAKRHRVVGVAHQVVKHPAARSRASLDLGRFTGPSSRLIHRRAVSGPSDVGER